MTATPEGQAAQWKLVPLHIDAERRQARAWAREIPCDSVFLVAAILFAVVPTFVVWAQERSDDTKSSGGNARSPAKKGMVKQNAKENGIIASPPAEPKEFDRSGFYGGVHGGVLGSTGQSGP